MLIYIEPTSPINRYGIWNFSTVRPNIINGKKLWIASVLDRGFADRDHFDLDHTVDKDHWDRNNRIKHKVKVK